MSGRRRRFAALVREVGACYACERVAHAHVLSNGNGLLNARIMFVAEAVGRRGGAVTGIPLTRDETGLRFQRFLQIAGIAREGTFITNAVLCNPLNDNGCNRAPTSTEIGRCNRYLARTLDIVDPPIVVTLGRVALESLRRIAPHNGELRQGVARPMPWHRRTLIPMYHPSRQSTLHRNDTDQESDWRRLGDVVRQILLQGTPPDTMRPMSNGATLTLT